MLHTKWFRALALLAAMAAAMYLDVSLFFPSSRRVMFGVDRKTGFVRRVQGRITFLPPHRYFPLNFENRDGYAQRDGLVRVLSKERIPVSIAFRVRFDIPDRHLGDARALVQSGWSAWILPRVAEAVSAMTQQFPIEELLLPTSQFAVRRQVLRDVVARHLAKSGLHVTAFEIGHIELDQKARVQDNRRDVASTGHLTDTDPSPPRAVHHDVAPRDARATALSPERWSEYAYYNNLGIVLHGRKKPDEAMAAFQKAIDLNPSRPVPYLNMAMTLLDRRKYTEAEAVFLEAVARGLPDAGRWLTDFAALYRSRGMTTRAIDLLYKGKRLYPESYLIAANLGSALAQANRFEEGVPELERALAMQTTSTLALNNLGTYYARKENYPRALDFWNRSLSLDPRQQEIREAANAARTRL
jgi:Flp pilus assembly protein TadD